MSARREITVPVETTAQAYLELLRARGFDYFFGNAGTDFGPLVDAFARFEAEGKDRPRPITVPHEFVAVSMAHGVTMCTGRPQVVMAHTIVGTANCAGALINAARANIPLFMSAGRTPLVESGLLGARDLHIHWAQEAYDQAGMIREFLRWDYELRNLIQLEAVVGRALAIATVGDGAYIFSVPTAAHMVSATYDLPILVVIFNNQCWGQSAGRRKGFSRRGGRKRPGLSPSVISSRLRRPRKLSRPMAGMGSG